LFHCFNDSRKNYSYLRASIGESLEAFLAGATPKIIPIAEETPKARSMEDAVILAGKAEFIANVPKKPRKIPIRPPRQDKIMASIRN
jgi:hypothetical protein